MCKRLRVPFFGPLGVLYDRNGNCRSVIFSFSTEEGNKEELLEVFGKRMVTCPESLYPSFWVFWSLYHLIFARKLLFYQMKSRTCEGIGLHFTIRNHYLWLSHKSTYLHRETNSMYSVSKMDQK